MPGCEKFGQSAAFVLREALEGVAGGMAADAAGGSVFLDDGTPGVLMLLDKLSAAEAARPVADFSVALHARHLAYSLAVYMRAVTLGNPAPIVENWPEWEEFALSDGDWAALRANLKTRAQDMPELVEAKRNYAGRELEFALGALAHTAFHFGVIQVKYDALKG